MPYLLGTDEAGYGPNLGPLVISASVWQVPEGVRGDELYQRLQSTIAPAPARKDDNRGLLVIGDSKTLYQSGNGLRQLERGLWAALSVLEKRPTTCGDVWSILTGPNCVSRREAFCDGCDAWTAPRDLDPTEVEGRLPKLCASFAAASVKLVDLRSVAVFPREFNETVDGCKSKGAALSRWTLELVARLIERLPDDRVFVVCDKHGGRDRYLPLLMDFFPETFIEVVAEGRAKSVYRFAPPERRVEFCFQAKGESHMPTALASMASKYLRELAMQAFNAFWLQHVPGLRPTAGYPVDALRFKSDIAAAQQALGIEDRILWRAK
jgi:hypothetical protein